MKYKQKPTHTHPPPKKTKKINKNHNITEPNSERHYLPITNEKSPTQVIFTQFYYPYPSFLKNLSLRKRKAG